MTPLLLTLGLSLSLTAGEPPVRLAHKGREAEVHKATEADQDLPIVDPDGALEALAAGNRRFQAGMRGRSARTGQEVRLREALAKGQAPFAVIVTCSDSRLMDNFIFDQELGRLFTIREAGNCLDLQGIASVEYAVEHLGSRVVVILGHTSCGAVKAVNEANGKPLPGNLWSLQAGMSGLLESNPPKPDEAPAERVKRLAEANARRQAQALLDRSVILQGAVAKGAVRIVPALYDLMSGSVTFLEAPGATHHAAH